jgi:predicted RNA binding protein with dsRBD fold (UPF0201 family)
MSFKSSPLLEVSVEFWAPVYTTENPDSVKQAVSHLLNAGHPKSEEIFVELTPADMDHIKTAAYFRGDLTSLSGIHYLIRREKIIDTARSEFMKGFFEDGCSTTVLLNKQAAFMKHLSFPADAEPLGSIELTIETETPEALLKVLDWLTPPTKEGAPVFELKITDI